MFLLLESCFLSLSRDGNLLKKACSPTWSYGYAIETVIYIHAHIFICIHIRYNTRYTHLNIDFIVYNDLNHTMYHVEVSMTFSIVVLPDKRVQAKPFFEAMNIQELADIQLYGDYNSQEMQCMMMAAALCVQPSPQCRPSMAQVGFECIFCYKFQFSKCS